MIEIYITISSIKKTLGKFIEFTDLYIGLPTFVLFLIIFSFTDKKIESLIFLSVCLFLLLPVNISKKNRMYKVLGLFCIYLFKCKNYAYFK